MSFVFNRRLQNWLLAFVAVAPFLMLYLVHFVHYGAAATGFLQYDMGYYAMNGRAIFERGNGLMYANPFDPDGHVIYFQLLPLILGVGVKLMHFDPGYLTVFLGALFAVMMSRVTLELVRDRLHDDRYLVRVFLMVMWGGGLLLLLAVAQRYTGLGSPRFNGYSFDPANGWWMLNWGRNSLFTTEALYHLLVAVVWLGLFRRRWALVLMGTILICLSHPWTAAELLAMLWGFIVVQWVSLRKWVPGRIQFTLLFVSLLFAGYYGLYLNQYTEHRAIVEVWKLNWTLTTIEFLMSVVLAALFALLWFSGHRFGHTKLDIGSVFLVCAFVVSALLTLHDRFMQGVQPIHFHHGYPVMALYLLGVSGVPDACAWFKRTVPIGLVRAAIMLVLFLVVASDNIYFVFQKAFTSIGHGQLGLSLHPDARAVLKDMDLRDIRGVLLADNGDLNYLSAAYSGAQPFLGHEYLTPHFREKDSTVTALIQKREIDAPAPITLMLLSEDHVGVDARWRTIIRHGAYTLWKRR